MSVFSPALSIADNTGKWHGSFLALVTFLCHLLATAWVVIPVSDSWLSTQAVRSSQSICAHCCRRICLSMVGSFADSTFSQETVSLFSMAVSVFFKSPPPCVLEHHMSVAYVKEWLTAFMDWWRALAATLTMTSQNSPGPFARLTSIQVLVISHWNIP